MKEFFSSVRRDIFSGSLSQGQVDGMNALIAAAKEAHWPSEWTAYLLATAYWETGRTVQPIKEWGGEAYFRRMYDIEGDRPDLARRLGNLNAGDGARYAGRGYVQLTGFSNYNLASSLVGVDLTAQPDLAMRPDIAARIAINGMESGWFTGKSLSDYLVDEPDRDRFIQARRIINGDVAKNGGKIADTALAFLRALQAVPLLLTDPVAEPAEDQPAKPSPREHLVATLAAAIARLFRRD